jgi:outer membrane protein OmpA-like peptidoglycan-associated protein
MYRTFMRVGALLAVLSLAACANTGPEPEVDAETTTEVEAATPSWSRPKPESVLQAENNPTAVSVADSSVALAKPDNLENTRIAHKQALLDSGEHMPNEEVGYYMDTQEARFLQLVRDDRVYMQRQDNSISLTLSGTDCFASNSSQLLPQMEGVLSAIAEVVVEYRDTRISIYGHTDDAGEEGYNQWLSERRARSLSRFFIDSGVAAERIVIIGHGESRPIEDNSTAAGQAANRRIEISLEPLAQ